MYQIIINPLSPSPVSLVLKHDPQWKQLDFVQIQVDSVISTYEVRKVTVGPAIPNGNNELVYSKLYELFG